MSFLKSFSINSNKTHTFPYNIDAIKFAKNGLVDKGVTIFIGDNGCGKSTLLEIIALKLNIPLIGGFVTDHRGFEAARILHSFLEIEVKRQTSKGFFFRAEGFSDFINIQWITVNGKFPKTCETLKAWLMIQLSTR